jgi:dopachrome tautomerase
MLFFTLIGLQFQWTDGLFSVALSTTKTDGSRTAFFHPLAGTGEFTVSTKILKNEDFASRRTHGTDFKFLGTRGPNSQSGTHFYDAKNHVLFFAEMQKNAISCWKIPTRTAMAKEALKPSNIHIVAQNNQTMIYPVDLEVNDEKSFSIIDFYVNFSVVSDRQ